MHALPSQLSVVLAFPASGAVVIPALQPPLTTAIAIASHAIRCARYYHPQDKTWAVGASAPYALSLASDAFTPIGGGWSITPPGGTIQQAMPRLQAYCNVPPTPAPTVSPTPVPTPCPTSGPSAFPTATPTPCPTLHPTARPTATPTPPPTPFPTAFPTPYPTPLEVGVAVTAQLAGRAIMGEYKLSKALVRAEFERSVAEATGLPAARVHAGSLLSTRRCDWVGMAVSAPEAATPALAAGASAASAAAAASVQHSRNAWARAQAARCLILTVHLRIDKAMCAGAHEGEVLTSEPSGLPKFCTAWSKSESAPTSFLVDLFMRPKFRALLAARCTMNGLELPPELLKLTLGGLTGMAQPLRLIGGHGEEEGTDGESAAEDAEEDADEAAKESAEQATAAAGGAATAAPEVGWAQAWKAQRSESEKAADLRPNAEQAERADANHARLKVAASAAAVAAVGTPAAQQGASESAAKGSGAAGSHGQVVLLTLVACAASAGLTIALLSRSRRSRGRRRPAAAGGGGSSSRGSAGGGGGGGCGGAGVAGGTSSGTGLELDPMAAGELALDGAVFEDTGHSVDLLDASAKPFAAVRSGYGGYGDGGEDGGGLGGVAGGGLLSDQLGSSGQSGGYGAAMSAAPVSLGELSDIADAGSSSLVDSFAAGVPIGGGGWQDDGGGSAGGAGTGFDPSSFEMALGAGGDEFDFDTQQAL